MKRIGSWLLSFNSWAIPSLLWGVALIFLVFYNLELNPRPWHDEGSTLAIAKTLVVDGVYAIRTSDGFQTFGGVQSVGPTVILPIAIAYKLLGVGLLNGRVVSAVYTLLTLFFFILTANKLFDRATALLATAFLISSPAVDFLYYGRQALGEVPALGFFLAGWFAWVRGLETQKTQYHIISGLMIGAAVVTKNIYLFLGAGTLCSLFVLDIFYFHQKAYKSLLLITLIAVLCNMSWNAWQLQYYGASVFHENTLKMNELAGVTVGVNAQSIKDAIKYLFGSGSGYFFFFWGWPAFIYLHIFSLGRNRKGLTFSFWTIFIYLCLAYYILFVIPWSRYIFPAMAIMSIFVGRLFLDVARGCFIKLRETFQSFSSNTLSATGNVLVVGVVSSFIVMSFGLFYELQRVVRADVLDTVGLQDGSSTTRPADFRSPGDVADYINAEIPQDAVIETWERELSVMTDGHIYHYPDQIMLAEAHAYNYRNGNHNYALSDPYFIDTRPSYLVVGWFARFTSVYDMDFVTAHGNLVDTFGNGDWRYDIYQMNLQK